MVDGPAVIDTNVLIYALSGTLPLARTVIEEARHWGLVISEITRIDLLTKVEEGLEIVTQRLLNECAVMPIDREIADVTIMLRQQYTKLKTPDAIIYATALVMNRNLFTFNKRDFRPDMRSVVLPA